MDYLDKCLDKFETKLRQYDRNNGILQSQIADLTERLQREVEGRQRDRQLTEAEANKCQQLSDRLIKSEFDIKIEFEKKSVEVSEEKQMYCNQMQRMCQQMSQLKLELSSLQTKNCHLEQLVAQKDAQIRSESAHNASFEPELKQIEKRTDALDNELKCLDQVLNHLKAMVESAVSLNGRLRSQLIERNQAIVASERSVSSLRKEVSELKQKCVQKNELIAEKDSHSASLTNQTNLLKKEIYDLRQSLTNAIDENKALIRRFTQNDMNSNDSVEQSLHNQVMAQTLPQSTVDVDDTPHSVPESTHSSAHE